MNQDTSPDLTSTVSSILDFCVEPLFITDDTCSVIYCNKAASVSLDSKSFEELMDDKALQDALSKIVKQSREQAPDIEHMTLGEASYYIRWIPLYVQENRIAGYAFTILSQNEFEKSLSVCPDSGQSLDVALLLGSFCLQKHRGVPLGVPGDPFKSIRKALKSETEQCNLRAVVSSVCEFIDSVLDPGIGVKAYGPSEELIAMRSSDLFQLVGLMIGALASVTVKGTISITWDPNVGFSTLALRVRSQPFSGPPETMAGLLMSVRDIQLPMSPNDLICPGLTAARHLAKDYGSAIECLKKDDGTFELTVQIPRVPEML